MTVLIVRVSFFVFVFVFMVPHVWAVLGALEVGLVVQVAVQVGLVVQVDLVGLGQLVAAVVEAVPR